MNVDDFVRERAVLKLFQAHHRNRRGCCLSAREIERAWKRTGLRRSDLQDALDDMVRRNLLQVRDGLLGQEYELSYLGECAMHVSPIARPVRHLRSWVTLQRARLRKPSPHPTAQQLRRRTSDRH
ncbi:MAG: hypothetical protein ACLGI7_13775 [Gammaproteobacteria bacterium]